MIEAVTEIPDFAAIRNVHARKKAFFAFLRPIVVSENARVAATRLRMLDVLEQLEHGKAVRETDADWLMSLAGDYRIPMSSIHDRSAWEMLKRRVDTVPYRLALAQAANETSWGTSRFAREGRNFFGQWCFTEGCGIVPARRQEGMTHEVAVFDSVNDSVASYLRHLNSMPVYKSLRQVRLEKRWDGSKPTASELAGGLTGYSAIGDTYVEAIRRMIRANYDLMGSARSRDS